MTQKVDLFQIFTHRVKINNKAGNELCLWLITLLLLMSELNITGPLWCNECTYDHESFLLEIMVDNCSWIFVSGYLTKVCNIQCMSAILEKSKTLLLLATLALSYLSWPKEKIMTCFNKSNVSKQGRNTRNPLFCILFHSLKVL